MYNLNNLKVRNIKKEDEKGSAKVFLEGFNNKIKNLSHIPEERTYDFLIDFGIVKNYYKEGYFVAEVDGEILGLMLLRWKGQEKQEDKVLDFSVLVKKYGLPLVVRTMIKVNIVNYNPKKGEMYIEHIAVLEKARGLGIGSILLERAFNMAKSRNDINKVTLSVIEENHRAHKLYNKLGFEDTHDTTSLLGKWAVGVYKFTKMEKCIV